MAIYHCDVELHNGRIMHSGVRAQPDKYSKRDFLLMSTEEHGEAGNDRYNKSPAAWLTQSIMPQRTV